MLSIGLDALGRPPKEPEFIRALRAGEISVPPCRLELVDERPASKPRVDGVIRVHWKQYEALYDFDYKSSLTPREFETQVALAFYHSRQKGGTERPLLIIRPFMDEHELLQLDENNLSGLDLSGNAVINAPDFRIWRSGSPNRFSTNRALRNPFGGDSSIFARCFLLRPQFESLSELQEFAHERTFGETKEASGHTGLSLGTASKVVRVLHEEGVVERVGQRLHLANAKRLLVLLRQRIDTHGNSSTVQLIGKTPLNPVEIWARLFEAKQAGMFRRVGTGVFSAGHYGVLSGADKLALYVSDLKAAGELLEVSQTRAFPNIQLLEERKHAVYFDSRPDPNQTNTVWASPIQTWLELASGGPREQEAAVLLESQILAGQAPSL